MLLDLLRLWPQVGAGEAALADGGGGGGGAAGLGVRRGGADVGHLRDWNRIE